MLQTITKSTSGDKTAPVNVSPVPRKNPAWLSCGHSSISMPSGSCKANAIGHHLLDIVECFHFVPCGSAETCNYSTLHCPGGGMDAPPPAATVNVTF